MLRDTFPIPQGFWQRHIDALRQYPNAVRHDMTALTKLITSIPDLQSTVMFLSGEPILLSDGTELYPMTNLARDIVDRRLWGLYPFLYMILDFAVRNRYIHGGLCEACRKELPNRIGNLNPDFWDRLEQYSNFAFYTYNDLYLGLEEAFPWTRV